MFSAVASAPSIDTAFTRDSSRDPRDMYPIAYSFSDTVVIITDVLFVTCASIVVISLSSSSTTPNSSVKAPLVPEPSSRDTTVIALAASQSEPDASLPPCAASSELLPHPVAATAIMLTTDKIAINFFILIFDNLLFQFRLLCVVFDHGIHHKREMLNVKSGEC